MAQHEGLTFNFKELKTKFKNDASVITQAKIVQYFACDVFVAMSVAERFKVLREKKTLLPVSLSRSRLEQR